MTEREFEDVVIHSYNTDRSRIEESIRLQFEGFAVTPEQLPFLEVIRLQAANTVRMNARESTSYNFLKQLHQLVLESQEQNIDSATVLHFIIEGLTEAFKE